LIVDESFRVKTMTSQLRVLQIITTVLLFLVDFRPVNAVILSFSNHGVCILRVWKMTLQKALD